MSRTHAHAREDSTSSDADRDNVFNLIAEGNRGDRPMSVDDQLEQRVVELEDRVAELEQLLNAAVETTEVPEADDIVGVDTGRSDESHPQPLDVIREIPGAYDDGVEIETVIATLEDEGINDPEERINELRRRGEIYNPSQDVVKVV